MRKVTPYVFCIPLCSLHPHNHHGIQIYQTDMPHKVQQIRLQAVAVRTFLPVTYKNNPASEKEH